MLREVISNEWLTILFVVSLILITTVKYIHSVRFHDFLLLLFNSNYIKIYNNERRLIDNFNLLLIINYIISVSIFIIITYNYLISTLNFNLTIFVKIAVGVLLFIVLKAFIEKLIGWIFDITPIINNYIIDKINYRNYIGLILVPVNIVLVFSFNPTKQILKIFIITLAILCLLGFVNFVKTNLKLIFRNLFYFILYLCALEIGPYIILYKLYNNI